MKRKTISIPTAALGVGVGVLASLTLALPTAPAQPISGGGEVTIHRDSYGVPHIIADTLPGLAYGHGWAQAHDRLWQAEILRRSATGTMAEWFGASQVEADVLARTIFGSEESRTALWSSASDELAATYDAFVDGMNAGIAHLQSEENLPPQYALLGAEPRPWTLDDTLAIGLLLNWEFGVAPAEQLANAAAFEALVSAYGEEEGAKKFADTRYLNDPSSPVNMAAAGCVDAEKTDAGGAAVPTPPIADPGPGAGLLRQIERMHEVYDTHWRPLFGGPGHSNAILLGPSMTANGQALLFGGPQMGQPQPQILHEVAWFGAGIEIRGFGAPGVPGPVQGATPTHAWTVTTGYTGNADYFINAQNPDNPGEYLYNGEWVSIGCHEEIIGLPGGGSVPVTICETEHGPVVAMEGGSIVTLKNAASAGLAQQAQGYIDLARAETLEEADAASSGFTYNFNILYANASGDIAHFHCGRIPIRAEGSHPFFPQDGGGGADWQGFIPWEEMPKVVNPEQGILVNWNNKPQCDWQSNEGNGSYWGPVHRVQTLIKHLADIEPGTATPETLAEINRLAGTTAVLPYASSTRTPVTMLLPLLTAAVDAGADPRLPMTLKMLGKWNQRLEDVNGDDKYDDASVTIFNHWLTRLRDHFAAMPGLTSISWQRDNLLARLLQGEDAALPLQGTYLDSGATPQSFVTDELIAALDDLEQDQQSQDPAQWLSDVVYSSWVPLPLMPQTLPDMPLHNRGTLHMIAAPGSSDTAQTVLPPGQSGRVDSPHFDDQYQLYYDWQYKTAYLTPEALSTDIQSTEVLSVPHPADFDGDGAVDEGDLLHLLGTWGPCADGEDCAEDLDGDDAVGVSDLLMLLANWG